MKQTTKRKLAFYEIKGLSLEAQLAFEKMQDHVVNNMTPASVTITIQLTPPEDDGGRFGRVAYSVATRTAPVKSKSYHTLFEGGKIIADGIDDADASQLDLEDLALEGERDDKVAESSVAEKNVIAINKEASNG